MPYQIEEEFFGLYASPMTHEVERIRRFTITNENNMKVRIINYGATVQSIEVPDAYNKFDDVVLGFNDVAGYLKTKPYNFGATVGRVTGVLTGAKVQLNEIAINLSRNHNDLDHKNGGYLGFDTAVWNLADVLADGIVLEHLSPDGHEGFPGNLLVRITFQVTNFNALRILIEAETDQPTLVNISNNIYFNLVGHSASRIALGEHMVSVKGSFILDTDAYQKPTGQFKCVAETVWDLHVPTNLGERLKQFDDLPLDGYDNCFCINDANGTDVIEAARIKHAHSGRVLDIYTNQPGLHFYTANDLPELRLGEFPIIGKDCSRYTRFGSFTMSPMKYPDSQEYPTFPTIQVNPGQKYVNETLYDFSVEESWKCCRDKLH